MGGLGAPPQSVNWLAGRGTAMAALILLLLAAALGDTREVDRGFQEKKGSLKQVLFRMKRQRNFPDRSEIFKDRNKVFEDTKREFPDRSEVFKDRNEVFANATRSFPDRNEAFKNNSREHFKNRNEVFGGMIKAEETTVVTKLDKIDTQKRTDEVTRSTTEMTTTQRMISTPTRRRTTAATINEAVTEREVNVGPPSSKPPLCADIPDYSNSCAITFATADCNGGWQLDVADGEERHFSSSPFKSGYSYR